MREHLVYDHRVFDAGDDYDRATGLWGGRSINSPPRVLELVALIPPLDSIAKLAPLMPIARINLIRFHGSVCSHQLA